MDLCGRGLLLGLNFGGVRYAGNVKYLLESSHPSCLRGRFEGTPLDRDPLGSKGSGDGLMSVLR